MSNYRIVTRAFPADYWADHGDEILDTANELHNEQWSARESRSLLAHGLRTRSLQATGGSTHQMWIQCAAFAVTWGVLNMTATAAADIFGLLPENFEIEQSALLAAWGGAVLVLLHRSTRAVILLPPMFAVLMLVEEDTFARPPLLYVLLVCALAVVVAWKSDGHRVLHPGGAVLLAVLHVAGLSIGAAVLGLLQLVLIPAGLLLLRLEPRLLGVAAVKVLLLFGTMMWSTDDALALGVVSAVLIVTATLASVGNRRLRQTI